jgi:hypothetical protein
MQDNHLYACMFGATFQQTNAPTSFYFNCYAFVALHLHQAGGGQG